MSHVSVLRCRGLLRYVAVHCGVLWCVAVCDSFWYFVCPHLAGCARNICKKVERKRRCQCVAEYCGVLQCIAACFSVLQCVAVCCSVLQFLVFHWPPPGKESLSHVYYDVCCRVLQSLVVCCSVLQCGAMCS